MRPDSIKLSPELLQALEGARAVRFLCSGNVVRSAFAELIARQRGCPLPVDSAATRFQNVQLFPETMAALIERGVSPHTCAIFQPRHLDRLPAPPPGDATLVLAMSREHQASWRAFADTPSFLLGELDPLGGGPLEIADPVLEGADFERTYARVERCVEHLLERLEARA